MITKIWPLPGWLFFFPFFLYPAVTPAFQVADGAPAAKYIFYWGNQQCDLSPSNNFRGAIRISPAAFRQMLNSTPRLWNGSALEKSLSFTIDDIRVTTDNYLEYIGLLHSRFGQNAVDGQQLLVSDLKLRDRRTGSVELLLESAEQKGEKTDAPWMETSNKLNREYLEAVVWGREDIYDISNRDFFTETEIWQTLRQLPIVDWQPYTNPQPLMAGIQIREQGSAFMNFRAGLEESAYRHMLKQVEHFRHLVCPGSSIELSLYTEKFDVLFQKNMTAVAENDPRLALRRNRDTHTLSIRMGPWEETIAPLYLQQMTNAQGKRIPADLPVNRRLFVRNYLFDLAALFHSVPECRLDGQPLHGLSFRVSMPGFSLRRSEESPLDDSLAREVMELYRKKGRMELDSFQLPGYELPPMHFTINEINMRQRLMSKNELHALRAAPGNVRLRLAAPADTGTAYHFPFELPEPGFISLSIFEAEGRNVFLKEEWFSAGANTLVVPKSAFAQAGKHYCFLNTPLGVVGQEFEVE